MALHSFRDLRAEGDPLLRIAVDRIRRIRPAAKKFSEPGALSSSAPTNFRLPPTAYRCGLDLLASRARCKEEPKGVKGWGSRGLELEKPQIAIFSLKGPTFAIDAFYKRQPSGVRAGNGRRIRNAKKIQRAGGGFVRSSDRRFRLRVLAFRWSLDLIPLRARCKREGRASTARGQETFAGTTRKLRLFLYTRACLRTLPHALCGW